MIIVDLIRSLMFQQRVTIKYLSQETGLSYTLIEDIVLKDTIPTPKEAELMLWVLGMELEDVLKIF